MERRRVRDVGLQHVSVASHGQDDQDSLDPPLDVFIFLNAAFVVLRHAQGGFLKLLFLRGGTTTEGFNLFLQTEREKQQKQQRE